MIGVGRHNGWQWALVEDQVAIDNMPEVREFKDDLDIKIKFQYAVIPVDVFKTVAERLNSDDAEPVSLDDGHGD